mgnify:CR=1 FL=1
MITNSSIGNLSLEEIAKSLDISPSDYERVKKAVSGVSACLENGHPEYYPGSPSKPKICLQGSMRHGTAIRPVRDGAEGDFDVDLVAELSAPKGKTDAKTIKQQIGKRLKDDGVYGPMLDEEGGRCWTLHYAEQNKVGFHLDVLPCVHEQDQLIADMAQDLQARLRTRTIGMLAIHGDTPNGLQAAIKRPSSSLSLQRSTAFCSNRLRQASTTVKIRCPTNWSARHCSGPSRS